MKSERDNVVNVKARCVHDLAVFHHVKPTRRILAAALKQYLFPVTIAKSGANACTKCPIVTLQYSDQFLFSVALGSKLRTDDISKWIVSSISASSALPKGPFFSSRFYSIARFVAIRRGMRSIGSQQYEHSLLAMFEKLDFAVQINRRLANDVDGNCAS